MTEQVGTRCQHCGAIWDHPVEFTPEGPHHGKVICGKCDRFIRWIPKPDRDKSKRTGKHRKLVKKYGDGYCQLCLTLEERLPAGETLEGHHIVEYQNGGQPSKDNTLILCSACHSLVNWRRTYRRHMVGEDGVYHAEDQRGEDPNGIGGTETMGTVEDNQTWQRQADESSVSGRRNTGE